MIGFLANSIGRWQLKKQFAKVNRETEAINISQVKKAVLVFTVLDEKEYTDILKISTDLKREEGISELTLLAYNPNKEIPKYIDDQQITLFGEKDLGITGIPKSEFAMELMREKFDLLLDFTPESFLPTDYFLALLYAKTKVGRVNDEKDYIFDLIIDIPIEATLLDLSKNMIRYLKMINKA